MSAREPHAAPKRDRRRLRCLVGRHPKTFDQRYVPEQDSWLPGVVATFCAACGKRVSWRFEA